jgi:hypothetical protein
MAHDEVISASSSPLLSLFFATAISLLLNCFKVHDFEVPTATCSAPHPLLSLSSFPHPAPLSPPFLVLPLAPLLSSPPLLAQRGRRQLEVLNGLRDQALLEGYAARIQRTFRLRRMLRTIKQNRKAVRHTDCYLRKMIRYYEFCVLIASCFQQAMLKEQEKSV